MHQEKDQIDEWTTLMGCQMHFHTRVQQESQEPMWSAGFTVYLLLYQKVVRLIRIAATHAQDVSIFRGLLELRCV